MNAGGVYWSINNAQHSRIASLTTDLLSESFSIRVLVSKLKCFGEVICRRLKSVVIILRLASDILKLIS